MTTREFRAEDVEGLAVMERVAPEDVKRWAETHAKIKPNAVFINDGKVVIACGLGILWPGVAESWIHIAQGCPGRALVEAKHLLYQWIEEYNLVRVAAIVRADWKEGNRFVEWLGMRKEAKLRKLLPDGVDANVWAVWRQ